MPRSGAEARRRLREAALELYLERGFDRTTAAEIAARAGVNERTFFRHFPDKREVLFDGEADLRAALMRAVAEAPEGLEPFEVLLSAFRTSARNLEHNRPYSQPRWRVIAATPALRERELAKHALLIDAVAEALRQRGIPDGVARLAARTGWAAYQHAVQAWVDDPAQSPEAHLQRAFDELRALATAPTRRRPPGG
ncbi:AcrR family transcriptional regulator [Amycolatopsis bartoniae]|uniref:TetR family transcriptional regulator n=1 Tax=Amycolatopsis bartoniae TaxID=941986 RepID=A0A8H9ITI6_9PSEU|nr:TetR family transcriptional regulator [Amycolatopsis bartoniae]MBB2936712.1 AcrR family transcriptional regulator [Amycolatopsis bartoniae]TVS99307.1 TetR family transcriptional regulator [Amycolatopsis bartoniae]GHF49647.1 TetR family transcriptional regulator [Amycolatopsis bartoniae]